MFLRTLILLFCLANLCCLTGHCAEPTGYYSTALGLTGSALRSALHQRIRAHTVIPYGSTDEAMMITDEDPNNTANVILIYSRISRAKSNFGGNVGQWNREHTWPDSLGIDGTGPAYSDLFHLRPADVQVNADRGNMPFDESNPGASGYQNPAHTTAPLCTQDADSWEPPAIVKGDLARCMFYMDVRYEGTSGEPNLQLTDNQALITTSSTYMGRLNTLLVWHFLDPVDAAERTRNDLVYNLYQGNRNPFIDRPEFVTALYGQVLDMLAARQGTQCQLSWPAVAPETMSLIETSQNLTAWSTVTGTVTTAGGTRTINLLLTGGRSFYRLRFIARDG